MCRMVVFSGDCARCKQHFVWTELGQELACLEAKNAGAFGKCRRGVDEEEHEYEQECDACAAITEADEGVGGMGDEVYWEELPPPTFQDVAGASGQHYPQPNAGGSGRKGKDRGRERDEDDRRRKKRKA
jgi:hypothetical protein